MPQCVRGVALIQIPVADTFTTRPLSPYNPQHPEVLLLEILRGYHPCLFPMVAFIGHLSLSEFTSATE